MRVTVGDATTLAVGLLTEAGLAHAKASATARAIVLAEAWGLRSHGLLRLPTYLRRTMAGGYPADAELTTVLDTGPLLTLDGGGGLGHWQLSTAVREAAARADRYGIGAVAVANSGHCGALGVYAGDLAATGMAGLVFSCGPAVLPPWGGAAPLLSTSPLAAGFPLPDGPAVVDLALTTVARGKIAQHAQSGTPLPDGWALDRDGVPTNDPSVALTGMLAPLGGAKGFALAFMVEALTAGLVGPRLSADVPDFFDTTQHHEPQQIAHLLVALDPRKSDGGGDPRAALRRLRALAEHTAALGGRVPGSRRTPADSVHDSDEIHVDEGLWADLQSMQIPDRVVHTDRPISSAHMRSDP
ncbi:MAG: Ldh family oxidoreductase [Nocardioidaceae bacterium]